MKRTFFYLFLLLILFLSGVVFRYGRPILLATGLVEQEIKIAGTGSMYPTFPKGEDKDDIVNAKETVAWPKMRTYPSGIEILGFHLFSYKLGRNDIVEIDNEKTKTLSKDKYGEEAGFVKRVIALPGDTIELKDGFVFLNSQRADEPFTAKPRSTYGGDTLSDCKVLHIPQDKVFVMGDNRKASLDSRYELGLIDIKDIHFVLPWDKQGEYRVLWRGTRDDASLANTTTLDGKEFVRLLNIKRKEKDLKPLNFKEQLSISGKIRAKAMIDANDFSTEATRSGVTMMQAIKTSGYRNIIFAEVFTKGFYETEELLDNFLEFPDTKKILFSSEYQDIGLSPVVGEVDGCPVEAVVAHLGGYVPPNYKKEDIDSWQKLVDNLNSVIPTWESLRKADSIDQNKVEKLLGLLDQRRNNARKIVTRMRSNQWLTDEEESLAQNDESLARNANDIIASLNNW